MRYAFLAQKGGQYQNHQSHTSEYSSGTQTVLRGALRICHAIFEIQQANLIYNEIRKYNFGKF
jgi:hypothetical protein